MFKIPYYVCGTKISRTDCHFAHKMAETKGEHITIDNLKLTCCKCNQQCKTEDFNNNKQRINKSDTVSMEI